MQDRLSGAIDSIPSHVFWDKNEELKANNYINENLADGKT